MDWTVIQNLLAKASDAQRSEDALRFSQAALNAANALLAQAHATAPPRPKDAPV